MEIQKNLGWGLMGFCVFQSLGYFAAAYPLFRLGCSLILFVALSCNLCYGLILYRQNSADMVYYSNPIMSCIPSIVLGVFVITAFIVGVFSGI